jgi:hypothetical protein
VPTLASVWEDVSGRDLADQGLEWPPDLFAFAGTVLGRAHAYRFAVSPPPGRQWPPRGSGTWNDVVCSAAEQWARWAEDPVGPPPELAARTWAALVDAGSVELDDIATGRAWPVCEALLTLLALSDEASAGVAGAVDPVRTAGFRFRGRAAELLARTGSLSTIAGYRLRVLPKVRTPPGGISFRSLSRYLCLRGPAVDVEWHKAPARRSGRGQQQANVLLLPWPLRVRQRDFRPLPGSVRRAEDEPFGIFEFAPAEPFDLDLVDRVLRAALDEVDGIDAVVLPESSVPAEDLEPLEALLARHGVTVLLAGGRATTGTPERLPRNWVHLGVHVGGCWAHYRQGKHHRWFLDESQINQYHLAGALHPSVRWWEAMEVPRRSLQFLELSEGLTIVAVVCEDLARLDEVAELLRDVGPTLVVTILLDGPQLASRWTARYASVLADDPGSAVLTLTAAGMVQRSRPAGMPPSHVVALWKDPATGVREIALEPGSHGVVMSVASTRARRRCADGRTPVDNATALVVAGLHQVTAGPENGKGTGGREVTGAALSADELTILTGWGDALAEALEYAPTQVDAVLADMRPGAPWRRQLDVAEPSPELTTAVAAVADAVVTAGGGDDAAVLAVLEHAPADGMAPVTLATRVLRTALEARRDQRMVRSRPR